MHWLEYCRRLAAINFFIRTDWLQTTVSKSRWLKMFVLITYLNSSEFLQYFSSAGHLLNPYSSSAKSYFVLGMNFIIFNKNEWEETSICNFEYTELYMYLILSKSEDMPWKSIELPLITYNMAHGYAVFQ